MSSKLIRYSIVYPNMTKKAREEDLGMFEFAINNIILSACDKGFTCKVGKPTKRGLKVTYTECNDLSKLDNIRERHLGKFTSYLCSNLSREDAAEFIAERLCKVTR